MIIEGLLLEQDVENDDPRLAGEYHTERMLLIPRGSANGEDLLIEIAEVRCGKETKKGQKINGVEQWIAHARRGAFTMESLSARLVRKVCVSANFVYLGNLYVESRERLEILLKSDGSRLLFE